MEIDGNTVIFIIIIIFLFFSSPGGNGVSSQYEFNQLQLLTSQFQTEFDSFQNLSYDSNFRNISGLKLSYKDILDNPSLNATYPIDLKEYDSWSNSEKYMIMPNEIIDNIKNGVWNMSIQNNSHQRNIFPPNITSTLLGNIKLLSNRKYGKVRMPVSNFYEPAKDFSENMPASGETYIDEWSDYGETHNVTFPNGELKIQLTHIDRVYKNLISKKRYFYNSQDDAWKLLNVKVDFTDKDENEKHSINTIGIYDIKNGRILAMSESAKFHSLFSLPHYLGIGIEDSEQRKIFEQSKRLIGEYWNTSNYLDTLTMGYLGSLYDDAIEKCEYMMFLQLEPWNHYSKDQLKMIDDELKWPLGRPTNLSHIPPINIKNGLFYSPDCGLSLSLENVMGERYELKIRSIRFHLLCGIVLFAAQIYLLLCQMQYTNTPSSVNKISFYCFSMINLVDGSLAILYFISSTLVPELYLPLVISAFASFILASIFETRYLISVYASQINEQNVSVLTLLRGHTNRTDDETNQRPVVIPDEASISGRLYGRFAFMLISFTFLILSSTVWPKRVRMVFEYSAIFILNSYWFPQIFRNAVKGIPSRRNRRRSEMLATRRQSKAPLLWTFIIGTTIIRTVPIIYFFTYSPNIFRHHQDTKFVVILSLWLLFQISILYSQDILGARWFLPQHYIPEGYIYFKPVGIKQLEEHGDIEDSEISTNKSPDEEHNHVKTTVECAICMSEVPVYVQEIPETHSVDIHEYMVTPCNHIFHTLCLENWMSYKLQCPVCRAPLPPV